jgi:hypothetical protein
MGGLKKGGPFASDLPEQARVICPFAKISIKNEYLLSRFRGATIDL